MVVAETLWSETIVWVSHFLAFLSLRAASAVATAERFPVIRAISSRRPNSRDGRIVSTGGLVIFFDSIVLTQYVDAFLNNLASTLPRDAKDGGAKLKRLA